MYRICCKPVSWLNEIEVHRNHVCQLTKTSRTITPRESCLGKPNYRYIPKYIMYESAPLVEFMCIVVTHMLGKSYCRRLRSLLLCSCDVLCV